MSVRIHYDAKTNAAYPRFSSEAVVESEEVTPGVVLDYYAEGRIVGMEVLRARTPGCGRARRGRVTIGNGACIKRSLRRSQWTTLGAG
jgi:uncharacterized protein YuzE